MAVAWNGHSIFVVLSMTACLSACSSSSRGTGPAADASSSEQDSASDARSDSGSGGEAATDSGSTTTGSGTFVGTVDGQPLTVVDGEYLYNPSQSVVLDIQLASVTGYCKALEILPANGTLARTTILEIGLVMPSQVLATGTFMLDDATLANTAYFTAAGPTCNFLVGPGHMSSSGTVTLTSVQPDVVGTFDIYFGSDHVTGSFDVRSCAFTPPAYDGGVDCVQP